MTLRRLLLLPLLIALAVTAAPAQAATTADDPATHIPTVSELRLGGPDHTLVGTEISALTVSVRLVASGGVVQGTQAENPVGSDGSPESLCPCVQFFADAVTGQGSRWLQAPLTLASGTTEDGVWTAQTPVTASQAGTWRVIRIGLAQGGEVSLARRAQPEVVVAGTDPVVLSVRQLTTTTTAGRPVTYTVSARLAASHKPVAGVRIGVTKNIECPNYQAASYVRTGADGTARWAGTYGAYLIVWRPLGPGKPGTIPEGEGICVESLPYRVGVTATASAHSVRAGARVRISGRISAICDPDAVPVLQRRVGRAWRTVNTKPAVRGSGRIGAGCTYTLIANPPRGAQAYRVYLPASCYGRAATSSRRLSVVGR